MGSLMTLGPAPDIKFRYAVVPEVDPDSDFNASTTSDGPDFLIWQLNNGLATGATKSLGRPTATPT